MSLSSFAQVCQHCVSDCHVTLKDAIAELDQNGKLKEERSKMHWNGGIKWNQNLCMLAGLCC